MVCPSTRDAEPCVRTTQHGKTGQHRDRNGRRWYYGDEMQRGMPQRYIYDSTPLVELVAATLREDSR